MARKRSGTAIWESGRWKGKITLGDGSRTLVELPSVPPVRSKEGKARAKDAAAAVDERERETGTILKAKLAAQGVTSRTPALPNETPSGWFDEWLKFCEARGETSVVDKRGHVKNHILPHLAHVARLAEMTTDDVEAIRNALDAKIASPDEEVRLSWKTAANVWGTFKAACREMSRSKRADLRIRKDNPSVDVDPPETGDERAKTFLFPSEFLKLVSCAEVPLYWRRLYAVTVYTGCRAGELKALLPADIDLEHGIISVTKALDRDGEIKSTKTGKTRDIPIEPMLMSLLEVLLAPKTSRWLRMPPDEDRAELLRSHLAKAGVKRAALFTSDARNKPLTFHDLRGTYATWAAVRGDDSLKIKQRCGHQSFQTTEGYVRAAEVLRAGGGFGIPFPALPAELLESSEQSDEPRGSGNLDVSKRSEPTTGGDEFLEKSAGDDERNRIQFPLGSPSRLSLQGVTGTFWSWCGGAGGIRETHGCPAAAAEGPPSSESLRSLRAAAQRAVDQTFHSFGGRINSLWLSRTRRRGIRTAPETEAEVG